MVETNVIGAELASLPLGSMISGPLNAAIEAQALAADTTVQFIQKVGLDKDNKVRNVSFAYDTPGGGTTKLDAPILTIVPIPFIRIKDMTVDFVFKINAVASDTSASNTKFGITTDVSGGFGPVKFGIQASFSHEQSSESKSSVDKSAELKMHVNAAQDDMPEGLKIVLSAITGSLAKAAEAQAAPAK